MRVHKKSWPRIDTHLHTHNLGSLRLSWLSDARCQRDRCLCLARHSICPYFPDISATPASLSPTPLPPPPPSSPLSRCTPLDITVLYTFKGDRRRLGGKRKQGGRDRLLTVYVAMCYAFPPYTRCTRIKGTESLCSGRSNGPDDGGKERVASYPFRLALYALDTRYTAKAFIPCPVTTAINSIFHSGTVAPTSSRSSPTSVSSSCLTELTFNIASVNRRYKKLGE